jgi:hypothetical protein
MWMLRLIAVEQDQVHQGERDDAAVEYKRATPGANHSDGLFKLTRQNKQILVYILFFSSEAHTRVWQTNQACDTNMCEKGCNAGA